MGISFDAVAAFPRTIEVRTVNSAGDVLHVEHVVERGMSLRDWFAGIALQGMLASDAHPDIVLEELMGTALARLNRAQFAYSLADAMLTARGDLDQRVADHVAQLEREGDEISAAADQDAEDRHSGGRGEVLDA